MHTYVTNDKIIPDTHMSRVNVGMGGLSFHVPSGARLVKTTRRERTNRKTCRPGSTLTAWTELTLHFDNGDEEVLSFFHN